MPLSGGGVHPIAYAGAGASGPGCSAVDPALDRRMRLLRPLLCRVVAPRVQERTVAVDAHPRVDRAALHPGCSGVSVRRVAGDQGLGASPRRPREEVSRCDRRPWRVGDRGRDADYPAPPTQIRTCPICAVDVVDHTYFGKSARPVRRGGCGNGATARLLGHRQTKGVAIGKPNLRPPRHISNLLAGSAPSLRYRVSATHRPRL